MKKMRIGILLIVVVAAATAVAGAIWATRADSTPTGVAPMQGNYSVAQAKGFTKFPLYNAGGSVSGYPLLAVQHDTQPADSITFVYGDCTPPQAADGSYDGGCAPPVQVQIWPACFRNPSSFATDMTFSPVGDKTTVRGVPTIFYEDGGRLEIQTGTSTLVIFADHDLTMKVADALRGVNNSIPTGVSLPAPAAGAMTGELKCS